MNLFNFLGEKEDDENESKDSLPPLDRIKKSMIFDLLNKTSSSERHFNSINEKLSLNDVFNKLHTSSSNTSNPHFPSFEKYESYYDYGKQLEHPDQPTLPFSDLMMHKKELSKIDETVNEMQANFDKIRIEECNYTKDITFHKEQCYATQSVLQAIALRDQYKIIRSHSQPDIDNYIEFTKKGEPFIDWSKKDIPIPSTMKNIKFSDAEGYITYLIDGVTPQEFKKIPSIVEYVDDIFFILEVIKVQNDKKFNFSNLQQAINNKINKTICQERVSLLKQRFQMHQTINNAKEMIDQKSIWGRDFYNMVKIDNHIHHSAAMNAQHLLSFIMKKMETEQDVEVCVDPETKKPITLKQIFDKYDLTIDKISLNNLDVKADRTIYQRFDNFNNKYNPMGQPIFREIFMKTDNHIEGRYLAELTREMINKLESDGYVYTEWRLSIYGKHRDEWKKLARWVQRNKLHSRCNRWMIQIPRLYSVYKKAGLVETFQQMMDHIFKPLFEVTADPEKDPDLFAFLRTLGGFDTVDDESTLENFFIDDLKTKPSQFTKDSNPHYAYWIYYFYTNLASLNILRKKRNLNTFKFRPHCGEAGNIDHLICSFLLSDGINHGILLEKNPVLLYMYYLKQIGLSVSPLSNNKLFLKYSHSPFFEFYKMGLNVTLSTDDPLILHTTNDPLLEEYSIASQMWDLSSVDLAEIARNSVKQSSFEKKIKVYWAGDYESYQATGNKPKNSNLPQSRFIYRLETLLGEYIYLHSFDDKQKQKQ